jgi:hypothetical protein
MKVITITLLCLQMNGEIKTNTIIITDRVNKQIVGYVCHGN